MSKRTVIESALILTAAGFITRILGFVYRIYLSNTIGAEGMGLYQLIMPVYSLAWSIACSGFTTTISKLTAEEKAKGQHGNIGRILKICVSISTVIAIILTFVLYGMAGFVAQAFFKDERLLLSLRILALCFPFMAAGSCIRGYFFGMQESMVPAVNQVLEQIVRMSIIFALITRFPHSDLAVTCAICVIGIVAEEIFSFAYIYISFKRRRRKSRVKSLPTYSVSKSLAIIGAMALPLAANRICGSLLAAIEDILIPQRMTLYTSSKTNAMVAFGQISGMAMPLIYFPSAILHAISVSLVPAISESAATGNFKKINITISRVMLFSTIIGIGAASLFVVFSSELGLIIYNQDIGHMLFILGFMCPFLYIQMTLGGILNGLGYQVFIFRNSLLSSIINIAFIYFLVPVKGTDGFILGWFVSLLIVCVLSLEKLNKSISLDIQIVNWFIKPILAAAGPALAMRLFAKKYLFVLFGERIGLLIAVLTLAVLYLLLILATGAIKISDITAILNVQKVKKRN